MGKRDKQAAKTAPAAHKLPTKQPTLFAASIILFALWFVFLLVTAMLG